ncbi:FHA domain-containing protein [Polyangium sp. y55x31]|uniref:FHA domain-containing protein n=1 Tax=Polyangium sp. y55x31 TaxID=3042688 RepID=UPI002482FFAB|nr:FHA domain-containing protein [Polyangium sp. y55x31]MDI1482386.1 FHA domain-containing protein [Polyangium sp. y55x31]
MVPGFGKQTLTIGSAPTCDVVIADPSVAPEHARLVHQGGGRLVFIGGGAAPSFANNRQLAPGEEVPFDFRTQFVVGRAPVPLSHPAIILSIMTTGSAPAPAGQLVIGRDPARASLVIQHPSVSSQHATVMLDRMLVVDNGSTSGTYVGTTKIQAAQPAPIDPNGVVAFGPVPVPVELLARLAQAARGGAPVVSGAYAQQPAAPMPQTNIAMPQQGYPPAQPQQGYPSVQQPQQGYPPVSGAAPAAGAPGKKNKTVLGQLDFAGPSGGGQKSIGRTPDNDIVIQHPQVSSRHALVHQMNGQLFVEDRGSANGTYVRGQRIPPGQKIGIQSGEKFFIGPMPLQIELGTSGAVQVVQEEYSADRWAGKPLYEIEAWSLVLEVPDRDNPSEMKRLLDDVSFKALPGDMIALMGPSGAGKTTLLLTLNGYLPPTSGVVRINGEDLYNIYDNLRGSIGYVPQDDLVHPELTVFEAVKYSAKFRLPPDYSEEEIDARVEQTIKDLGLEGVKNLQIGKPEKKILSGGQRKRVNIALELVTDPVILFLDEPTSGLAADDTTALITLLHDLTKATGKTIIMTIHQPAKDEYEKFSHALIMGYGGVPMFFGSTHGESYRFFGSWKERQGQRNDIDNPRDMFEMIASREKTIYDQMRSRDPNVPRGHARKTAALEWRREYFSDQNPTYRKMYTGRREIGTGQGQRAIPERRATTKGQLGLLLSRYFKTKMRDTAGTVIMLAQAPIIGVLLAIVFGWQEKAVPAWCLGALQELGKKFGGNTNTGDILKGMTATADNTGAIFFLVVASVWFGTSNAAREIVSERAIYMRERMVTLGLLNYVLSKYILLAFFCIIQCTILLAIVFFTLGFHGGPTAFLMQLSSLVATSLAAVALGLLLSTVVTSSEAAMALTPIALIPQVVLGGLMVPMTTVPHLKPLMMIMPARWGFEGSIVHERLALKEDPSWVIDLGRTESAPADFIEAGKFKCSIAQMASDNLAGGWGFTNYESTWLPFAVLGGFTISLVVVLCVILKRRDPV